MLVLDLSGPTVRVLIDQAISRYRSRMRQPCDYCSAEISHDIVNECTSYTEFTATWRIKPTRCTFDEQCTAAITIAWRCPNGPDRRHRVTASSSTCSNRLHHELQFRVTTVATDATLFDVYSAHSLPLPSTTMSRRRQRRGSPSWVARPATQCRSHARGPHCVQLTEACRS